MTETKRVRRTPINGTRNKLSITNHDPDKHYHWVLDVDDGIQRALDKGYIFESKDKHVVGDKRVADATPMGSAQTLKNKNGDMQYLMSVPKEWKADDDAERAKAVDRTEQTLREDPESKGLTRIKFNSKT